MFPLARKGGDQGRADPPMSTCAHVNRLSVTVDGRLFHGDLAQAITLAPDHFAGDAYHTVGFVLTNTTAPRPLHFIVYQHVVAFRVSGSPGCFTCSSLNPSPCTLQPSP